MSELNLKFFSYGFYTDARSECFEKFGSIFDVPVVPSLMGEINTTYQGGKVLDVGAAKEKVLMRDMALDDNNYFTLDNDPEGGFDFNTISEIPNDMRFSMMVANQFFEHLTIDEAVEYIQLLSDYLEEGGVFIASVPNVSHPNRYWGDPTHRTPWDYKGLYMIMKYGGLETLKIARFGKAHPQSLLDRFLAKSMARIYRIDWCDSILIIAQK